MGHTTFDSRSAATAGTTAGVALTRRAEVQGERFQVAERLVLAPTGGIFEPAPDLGAGRRIEAGQVVGHMSSGGERTPIVSMFAGQGGDSLAWAGERLTSHQPVLWLSTNVGAS